MRAGGARSVTETEGGRIPTDDPRYWEIFFEVHTGLPREAPGDPDSGLRALGMIADLPPEPLTLDLACGPGASLPPPRPRRRGATSWGSTFTPRFSGRCGSGPAARVSARAFLGVHANMEALPFAPESFDLVWCEGGLYNAGFRRGLEICRDVLKPGGHLAATEAVWLVSDPAEEVRRWWEGEYPGITSIGECLRMIDETGLAVLGHFTLPGSAWWGYYRPIEARLAELREKHAGDPPRPRAPRRARGRDRHVSPIWAELWLRVLRLPERAGGTRGTERWRQLGIERLPPGER